MKDFRSGCWCWRPPSAGSPHLLSREAAAPTPWELKPDTGYAYDKEGKTFQYKMGTNNAGTLLKGAKKVPKGTLFFIGQNGQLYMRTGPYLEGAASSCSDRIEGSCRPCERRDPYRGIHRCESGGTRLSATTTPVWLWVPARASLSAGTTNQ